MKYCGLKPLLLVVLLQLLFAGSGTAQSALRLGTPFIQNYHPKQYAEVSVSPQNWAIIRDNRGILYVGNTEGLLEYDGTNWRIIKTSNNSIVRSLAKDSKGTIYVGASGDFGYLKTDEKGKKNYQSLIKKIPENERKFNDIWFTTTFNGEVYFIANNKIFIYDQDTISVTHTDTRVYGFEANNQLFLRKNNGLYSFQNQQLQLLPGTDKYNFVFAMDYRNKKILGVTEDNKWVTYNMAVLNNATEPSVAMQNDSLINEVQLPIQDTMANATPYSGIKINNNRFAMGTYRNGIFVFNSRGQLKQLIKENYGLQSDAIYTLYVDNKNRLWTGLEKGFSKIDIKSPITLFNQAHGINGTPISMQRYQGALYVGSTHGIFTNNKGNQHQNKFIKAPGINTTVWEFGHSNNTLFAFTSNGMFQIPPENQLKEISDTSIASHAFSSRFFNVVFLGLWDGMTAYRLNFPEEPTGEVTVADTIEFPEITNSIRKITEDEEGNLWLSTDYNGLIKLNFHGGSPENYEIIRYKKNSGLPRLNNNRVYKIRNDIFITTRDGIYIPKKERATSHDTTLEFVPEPNFGPIFNEEEMPVLQILNNQKGERFVFVEAEGFGKIYKKNGEWVWEKTPFKKIPSRAIYRFYIDRRNIIWAIGSENIYRYSPDIEKDYDIGFQTLIRRISTGDSLLFYGSTDTTQLNFSELTHRQNSVTFEFAAPFFDRENEIQYQYILEGFEETWSEWSENNIKEYTNLPPGDYNFKVRSRNIFGKISKPATYHIKVYPAWYNTIYAYIGYGLIAIILFYFAVLLYSRRLKQINQRLEQMVNERTEKMRKQNEEIAKQNEEILKQNSEISQQKKEIQKKTHELERKNADLQNLSIVAEETDNAIMITDPKGNFEWINKGYTRIFGLTFEQLTKKSKNIIGPNTPAHAKDKIRKAINEKETIYYEFSTKNSEGKDIYVQATLTPVVNQYGKVVKLVAVDADITRIKQAEEEIKKQKEEIERQRDIYKKQKNQIEKAYQNIKLLSEFGQKITSTLDLDSINNMIYDYVNNLMHIDAFGIGEYNETDKVIEFKGFMEKGIPVPYFSFSQGQDDSLVVWAFENKQDLLINDLENEYSKYVSQKPSYETSEQPQSAIIVPLLIESEPIGVVTAQSYRKNDFTSNDLSLFKSLASYIAIALENTRVYKLIKNKNQHINSSIRYAQTLQKAILPSKSHLSSVFEHFTIYRPKEVVSGDFYWFREIEQPYSETNFYFLAVIDCTGHGVPGAFMSIIGNRILNEIMEKQIYEPDQILAEMNKRIIEVLNQDESENNDGMDVAIAKFERVHDNKIIVTFSGAKRPLYYYSANNKTLETVRGDRKSVGGIRALNKNQQYTSNEVLLSTGDQIYMLSDGIVDQHGPDRKRFGSPRLTKLLESNAEKPLKQQKQLLEETLDDYMKQEPQRDDITILGLLL